MEKQPLDKRIDLVSDKHKNDPYLREKELKLLLKEAEKCADLHAIGKTNLYISISIFNQGKRGSMLGYAYKAVSVLEKLNDPSLLAQSYNLMGIAYAGLGSFQSAITYYNKALQLVQGKKNPSIRKETLLNNIGDSYFQMGAFQKSLRISLDCLSGCRKKNPENHRAMILYGINCSDSFCSLGQFSQAKEALDSVEPDAKYIEHPILLCGYYTRRSYVLYAIGNAEEGAKNADLVLELAHSNGDSYEFHYYFEQIVGFQIKIGDLERAKRFSDTLTQYASVGGHTLDQITAKRVEAMLCIVCGDRDRALELYKEIASLFDELLKEKREIQYESQKSVDIARLEISKMMQKIRMNEEKAERDALTGLMNRSALVTVSGEFIENAKKNKKKLGGIFLDIDYFKEYNDTYGHAAGDEAIKLIANVCKAEVNASVKFFRYGGDEYFGLVLGHSNKKMEELVLRIYDNVRSSGVKHVKNPNGQRLTVSVGVVNVDLQNTDITILDIIKYADRALYHAKDRGKDDVFAYIPMPGSEHEYKRISPDAFLVQEQ